MSYNIPQPVTLRKIFFSGCHSQYAQHAVHSARAITLSEISPSSPLTQSLSVNTYAYTYTVSIARDHKLTDILVKMYNRRETTESHILSLLPPKRRHIYSGKVQIYWIKKTLSNTKKCNKIYAIYVLSFTPSFTICFQ